MKIHKVIWVITLLMAFNARGMDDPLQMLIKDVEKLGKEYSLGKINRGLFVQSLGEAERKFSEIIVAIREMIKINIENYKNNSRTNLGQYIQIAEYNVETFNESQNVPGQWNSLPPEAKNLLITYSEKISNVWKMDPVRATDMGFMMTLPRKEYEKVKNTKPVVVMDKNLKTCEAELIYDETLYIIYIKSGSNDTWVPEKIVRYTKKQN